MDGSRAGGDVDSTGDQTRLTPTTMSRPSTGGEPDGSVAPNDKEMDLNNGESASGGRPKKLRRRWTKDADVICVHAVRSANAHRAPLGKRVERYGEAKRIFNDYPQAPFKVEYKAIRDRWLLLYDHFALKDKKEALITGQEKDVTNLDKLLIDAVEEAQDHTRLEDEAQGEQDGKEQRLFQRGEIIRRMAMERRAHRNADGLADASAPSRDPTSGRGDTTAPPGSPGSSKSTPTWRGRRRKRCEIEDDDVVDLLENSEKRRWDLKSKEIELGERRLNQERQLHDEETARRDRFEKEMRERMDRRDKSSARREPHFYKLFPPW